MHRSMLLFDFQIIRPKFETAQSATLDWIVEAHVKAAAAQGEEAVSFRKKIAEKLWHVGCKPDRIEKRGHVFADFHSTDWKNMEIYALEEAPQGKDLSFRSKVFEKEVDAVFQKFYESEKKAPDDLIHVSCTGYVSPSGAQKIVSQKDWGNQTTVTHAYHMGCYGSIPALRMAIGFLKQEKKKKRSDIVHTEICSLHLNPSLHSTDQLVTQSLFADGFIKYSIAKKTKATHFKISALQEEIIPNSTRSMTWNVVDWGNQMYLGKEVPVLITRHLPGYLERLAEKGGRSLEGALFAVHPGGPKILAHVQELLGLNEEQLRHSYEILKLNGNMSSATLPHIWQRFLEDDRVPANTPIVSLAFGPGLSISGSLMEKRCGG